jgi:hypothetical protein
MTNNPLFPRVSRGEGENIGSKSRSESTGHWFLLKPGNFFGKVVKTDWFYKIGTVRFYHFSAVLRKNSRIFRSYFWLRNNKQYQHPP